MRSPSAKKLNIEIQPQKMTFLLNFQLPNKFSRQSCSQTLLPPQKNNCWKIIESIGAVIKHFHTIH